MRNSFDELRLLVPYQLSWVLLFAVALALAGCTPQGSIKGNPCAPQCNGTCDVDDNCGGLCPCDTDHNNIDTTTKQLDCSQCQENELCQDGQCVCLPSCDGTRCDDGCGGSCECLGNDVCDDQGRCVPKEKCKDTCAGLGWECSRVCDEVCGKCSADQSCGTDHRCAGAQSCADCPLSLVLLDSTTEGLKLKSITLGLDYRPQTGEPRPRLADIQIFADAKARLVEVQPGPALTVAHKALFVDPQTGKPFRQRDDGAYQMIVQSDGTAVQEIEAGRLLTLTFGADSLGPISFHLAKRDQVFAPFSADAPLQATDYEKPLAVSK